MFGLNGTNPSNARYAYVGELLQSAAFEDDRGQLWIVTDGGTKDETFCLNCETFDVERIPDKTWVEVVSIKIERITP